MAAYILRRLLQAIPTFLGITFLSFFMILSAPGDPISQIMFNPRTTPEATAILRHQLGLDQPVWPQYVYWLMGNDWVGLGGPEGGSQYGIRPRLLHGHLGHSLVQ